MWCQNMNYGQIGIFLKMLYTLVIFLSDIGGVPWLGDASEVYSSCIQLCINFLCNPRNILALLIPW